MPRKGSDLNRVASTKLSKIDFEFLEKYAKLYYNQGHITQPTISHFLRLIVITYRTFVETKLGDGRNQPAAAKSKSESTERSPFHDEIKLTGIVDRSTFRFLFETKYELNFQSRVRSHVLVLLSIIKS
jgi:hypothetical protein